MLGSLFILSLSLDGEGREREEGGGLMTKLAWDIEVKEIEN